MKSADLHVHSYFSDGTSSPKTIVQEALAAELSCIALTDHDCISGIEPVRKEAGESLEVIAGIELTAQCEEKEIHFLGYCIDTTSPALNAELAKMMEIRKQRIYEMVEKLKKQNIDIKPEDVFALAGCGTVGRLHLARALLERGKISNVYEAFNRYIGNNGPAYVGSFSLTPHEAIQLIKNAGGIAVLAHPYSSRCDDLIPGFVRMGLQGLEVFYAEHTESIRRHYLHIANEYGLLVTGGSDYHGDAKPDIKFGKIMLPHTYVEALKKAKHG